MDLNTFVKETLTQIVKGVVDAQNELGDSSKSINPDLLMTNPNFAGYIGSNKDKDPVYLVDFDVSLIVKEGSEKKEGIGIFVVGIGLGSSGEKNTENAAVSRVKFSVPVALPNSDKKLNSKNNNE